MLKHTSFGTPDRLSFHRFLFSFLFVSALMGSYLVVPVWGDTTDQSQESLSAADVDFFENKIRPVLVQHCYECHAADSKIIRGGLLLDTREGLLEGGDSGPAIVPGDLDESLIVGALRHESFEMPPDERLSDEIIANFEEWIERGAPDPRQRGAAVRRGVDYEAGREHWAFQPLRTPPLPEVADSEWVRTPLDRFILARLEHEGLSPTPEADRRTFIRRATFGLTGLPPTPEEIERFLADEDPGSHARLVDRLLDSPHYGERWGRHWLDLVRYADTNGADENHQMPEAWRYRDWVIRMINRDLPLDEFLVQQLAGDLLPVPEDEEAAGDLITATGMLVVGPKMLAEQDKDKMIIDIVDEQIDTVTRTVLGLTIGCARCHDHKFDPISAKDYYALAGIFYSTQSMADRAFVSQWMERPLPSEEIDLQRTAYQPKIDEAKARLDDLTAEVEKAKAELESKEAESAVADREATAARLAQAEEEVKKQKEELEKVEKEMPQFVMVMSVKEAEPKDLPVHIRGNHLTLAEDRVPRGAPQILTDTVPLPEISTSSSGRLELARWLTSPEHPLTARVMANRIWMWHFGQALVRSPSNFGLYGEQPTHPELLDWLATEMIRQGWSLKEMHRQIMLSSTYRMGSQSNPEFEERDPENRLWWRRNRKRLEAEPIRDSVLAIGGSLDMTLGGKAADVEAPRRAVYLPINRSALYEMFSTFDYVETANHIEQRPTTTVPHQALFLLNSPMVHQQSETLARLVLSTHEQEAARVEALFTRLYGRSPSPEEVARTLEFVSQAEQLIPEEGMETPSPESPRRRGRRGTLATEQVVTAEVVSKAAEVTEQPDNAWDRRTVQAWASLCRTMIAANEFVYID